MSLPDPTKGEIIEGQPDALRQDRRWHIDHSQGALNSSDKAPFEPSEQEIADTIASSEVLIESHPIEDASADVPADSGGDDG